MKIAFHLYFMGLRGTEVATHDFAHYNEEILGNESIILAPIDKGSYTTPEGEVFFSDRFQIHKYQDIQSLDSTLSRLSVDAVYNHEVFADATWTCPSCRTLVHGVFRWCKPRGDAFACVSEWLGRYWGQPHVPLMISLPDIDSHLRNELNIPKDAIVIGRYGGSDTFNVPFTHQSIQDTLKVRSDIYFIFMNTDSFMTDHPRVIHLKGTTDKIKKVEFINTCDAMLHARSHGESFGLAVGEFSSKNKPVITFKGGDDKAHIEHLRQKGIFYENKEDLDDILQYFTPDPNMNWDVFSEDFSTKSVMAKFNEVFLS